jgi:hypothetical protein
MSNAKEGIADQKSGVRQTLKRERIPDLLQVMEFQNLPAWKSL